MVAMGMGSTKRGVVWCVGLLVAGLLLVAAEADFCSEDCRGKTHFLGCVRRCRSDLEVARPANCVALCHGKPNFMACCNRHWYTRRATPHMRRAGGKSTRHEEEASGGAVGVLKAPAPAPCEVVCRDRVGWEEYERCLDRCRWGAYVRRVLLHLKLVGRESATHEEARGGAAADVLPAMAARLSDPCKDFCTNHKHFDWCVHRCRFGPHLRLAGAGGESEEASRGAVDVLRATAAVDPRICEEFCRYWPEPDHDDCVKLCLIGAYVQQAHPHLKLAGGEYLTDEEEATGGAAEIPKAAMVRIPDRCVFFCRDLVEDYESCLFSCRTGAPVHHKLAGGSGAEESTTRKEEAPGGAVHVPAAQVQHEAAAGAQPMNTDPCEAYCKTHARDFPAKYDVCVRQCRSGGQPGRETMVQDEEASGGVVDVPAAEAAPVHHEAVAGAQPMKNTDPCEDYCMEQTRYFPRPGQFFDCVEECHAGHGRLTGDGRNGILRRVKQEPEKKDDEAKPQLGLGTGNIAME